MARTLFVTIIAPARHEGTSERCYSLLDTTYNIGTPEGVELRLPVAGIGSRSLAWLIDAMIKAVALTLLSILFGFLGKFGDGIMLLCMFLALWFYNVLFEVLNHGATPGKRALGLRVMNINGTPVGWSASILRNLIRFVDTLPGCYAFGCISVMVSKNFQRLGDLAAGTIVVYKNTPVALSRANKSPPEPVKIPLSLDEQQAIVSFGERASGLNSERAEELASILKPMFPAITKDRLSAYASWLVSGGRTP